MDLIVQRISPRALNAVRSWGEDVAIADVRTSAEFAVMHAPETRSLPLERLRPAAVWDAFQREDLGRGRPLYLLCQSGYRAALAAEQLDAAGLDNVVVVDGGLQAWADAGLPLVQTRQQAMLPLPNQVQVLVGAFLLLVTVLGLSLHPAWFMLTPAAGLGLIHAGVTRSCVLANWLARLPWNRPPGGIQAA